MELMVPDAFYKFIETSPVPRDVAFSLCTAFDYDPFMRIYTSCDLDNPIENDDACDLRLRNNTNNTFQEPPIT